MIGVFAAVRKWHVLSLIAVMLVLGCGEKDTLDDADRHMLAGIQARDAGDMEKAVTEFTAALAVRPEVAAYYERAQIYIKQSKEDLARADCEAGLQVQPDNKDLAWLLGEIKKPAPRRFQGKSAEPPRAVK